MVEVVEKKWTAALRGHNYLQKRYSGDEEDRKGGEEKEMRG